MPRKTFIAGQKLFAADVNTFLMDQAVMVFDDATARDTAIPTPVQGMVTFLKDLNVLEAWFGDRWGQVSGAGSITVSESAPTGADVEDGALWFNSVLGRTFIYYEDTDSAQWVEIGAGSGPTAAAVLTSAPTSAEQGQLWFDAETGNMYFYYVDNDSAQWIQVRSAAPAAGDLDSLDDVTITTPADGDTIVYDSATGEWENSPSGKILQVVHVTRTDPMVTGSVGVSDFVDIPNLFATITPTSATSKILVSSIVHASGGNGVRVATRILRGSTVLDIGDAGTGQTRAGAGAFVDVNGIVAMANMTQTVLDSPNTTSALTYKVQVGNVQTGAVSFLTVNRTSDDVGDGFRLRVTSSITLMEVSA
jgi:hypothetical protein